jgi:hypothetical protein
MTTRFFRESKTLKNFRGPYLNLQKMKDEAEIALTGADLEVRLKHTTYGFPKGFDDHDVLSWVNGSGFDVVPRCELPVKEARGDGIPLS